MQPEGLLRGALEGRPEAYRATDQPGVMSVLEETAEILDGVAQAMHAPLLRHLAAQGGEVFGVEVGDEARFAEFGNEERHRRLVVRPCPRAQFTGLDECLFVIEEGVAQLL